MRKMEEIVLNPRIKIERMGCDGFQGIVCFPLWHGSIIVSTGCGWEHCSVAPFKKRITASWDEMCAIKDAIFNDDEAVIQIHPPKAEYINNVSNCLHLWRCTYKEMVLPPSVLVSCRKGQTRQEIINEIKEAYEIAGEKFDDRGL